MNYKGRRLTEITEHQIVSPPKKMLVWDDGYFECYEKEVIAITASGILGRLSSANKDVKLYDHCAEIPDETEPVIATYRQVSKWLAQGNGEITEGLCDMNRNGPYCKTSLYYDASKLNEICGKEVRVRKWDTVDWHEPTIEYLGLEG